MTMLLSLLQMHRHFRRMGVGQLQAVLHAIRVYREGF